MENKLIVSYAPHVRSERSTRQLMLDVIIALLPAMLVGIWAFGIRALIMLLVCSVTAVLAEHVFCVLSKKETTVTDLSAIVTGLLLACNMPAAAPFWMGAVGSVFAIIIVKCFFGGLGHNFVNPALAARAFLMACWPVAMTTWIQPVAGDIFNFSDFTLSSATPLAAEAGAYSYMDLFLGHVPGCIGEISAFALLIGFVYLLCTKVITWHVPVIYIGTAFVFSYILGLDGVEEIFSGGLFLGAIFMATDYVTSPMTIKGHIVYAFLLGILTMVIRHFGTLPEGVSYSILIMNVVTPLIDKCTKNKKYGGAKQNG
ncbi:MAG: RnfABCDGE type electron transport complex subunit D [Clostridia bacterium]|nr:RnfABCDGE type electron transport complex subunit D [Clostridia bacterium]